jgi:hypothetical protein
MSLTLTATITGSTSNRLTWDPSLAPAATFTVFRGTTNSFGSATALGSPLAAGTPWFNDYTASPATTYYYWIRDQNSNLYGPASATTLASTVNQDAIDEAQLDALNAWAFSTWGGLYPVRLRYQGMAAPPKPWIGFNVQMVADPGQDDGLISAGEAVAGGRIATVSVAVFSSPKPPVRGLLNVATLEAGDYTVTINGTAYTVTYGSPPANASQVVTDLQAVLDALDPQAFTTLQYGLDPANQGLAVENYSPTGPLAVTVSSNLTWATYRPPKAMTLAQRLHASLGDPGQLDALSAAGIGVGKRHGPQDVSAMLDTEAEMQVTFDFYANVAEVYPINPGVIDTVTAPTGTFTY